MILRRLAQSFRKQDWVAVGLEIVIVVAGIFVGLQVTDWNEQRQLREREVNYLIRLAEDVGAMRTEIAEIQARAEGSPENALRAFRALEACDAACGNRELRNAAWEIYDLFWDWQGATRRAFDQLDSFSVRLDDHLAARGVADSS